ncbi:MAG TPA: hypothetical protein VH595_17790 [Verrucomicrobiae bacterium]|jgi:hypothetical protein|nr:hypothetical protein [Verrucomicrobiae bacterium]
MKVIQANCRVQFTASDVDFILGVLGKHRNDAASLTSLLADPETRDLILDDEMLFRALLEQRGCLRVSARLYFYVLVRHVLRRSGLDDRRVADYVAELLTQFSREERRDCVVPGRPGRLQYFFEMLTALETADDHTAFCIRAHIGNHSLFLSGVFPEHILHRVERRGAPGLRYYQDLGRANYRAASHHRLAARYDLASVFDTLSEQFEPARRALNDLSERLFSLGDPEVPGHLLNPAN